MSNYNIFMLKEEQEIFKKFSDADSAMLSQSEFETLYKYGLVKGALDGHSNWFDNIPTIGIAEISDFGKHYREYIAQEERKERKHDRRFWIPIAIDTVLSVTAIIISIITLTTCSC